MGGDAPDGHIVLRAKPAPSISSLHPGELELAHYLRGTLPRGHASAVFAHALLCLQCQQRLELLLAKGPLALTPRGLRRADEPPP